MSFEKYQQEILTAFRTDDGGKLSFYIDKLQSLNQIPFDEKTEKLVLDLAKGNYLEEAESLFYVLTTKCPQFKNAKDLKTKLHAINLENNFNDGKKNYDQAQKLSKKFLAENIKGSTERPNEQSLAKTRKKVHQHLKTSVLKFLQVLVFDPENLDAFDFIIKASSDLGDFETCEKYRLEKETLVQKLTEEQDIIEQDQLRETEEQRRDDEEKNRAIIVVEEKEKAILRADEALVNGNFRAALVQYSEILNKEKDNTRAMLGKLDSLLGLKDFEIAKKTLAFYLRNYQDQKLVSFSARIDREEIKYLKEGSIKKLEKLILKGDKARKSEFSKIHDELVKALKVAPKDIEILDGIYTTLQYTGDSAQAQMILKRIFSLNPKFVSKFQKTSENKCFVITCLFGPFSKEVYFLRTFRDRVLKRFLAGRILISCYYFLVPLLIEVFYSRPKLRKSARKVFKNFVIPELKGKFGNLLHKE
ncbi:CFI-box-CTERM domain-containing protein [Candidatus Riflebacteria bacterium]